MTLDSDTVLRLALEAGLAWTTSEGNCIAPGVQRFAALVAAEAAKDMRERAAKVAEHHWEGAIADAIRALPLSQPASETG